MNNKTFKVIFLVFSALFLLLPVIFFNRKNNTVSETEKRYLASKPILYSADGVLNLHFASDFEKWINDNIGFRSLMTGMNVKIKYYLFDTIDNNSDMYLGAYGELNYATADMISDYQHNNLYSEEYLEQYAKSMKIISDYVQSRGADFYYLQCWDKHSIYPEYFPQTVISHGNNSKTDGMIDALLAYTDVSVINPKDCLISAKSKYDTYSVWGDPSHWTPRGAYLTYIQVMEKINSDYNNQFRVLNEDDYDIGMQDMGQVLIGGVHENCMVEVFDIKESHAVLHRDLLTYGSDDERHAYFTNADVNNDKRLLIMGDSYISAFLMDDFSESFKETILIWNWNMENFGEVFDTYNPDIVLIEAAERNDISAGVMLGAEKLQ